MKNFFKFIFASCLGTLLALGAMTLIFVSAASSLGKQADNVKVKSNSVLKLTFGDPIPEKTNNMAPSGALNFSFNDSPLGLHDMIDAIEAAKDDDNIKGIYMELSTNFSAGMATMSALREALEDFKESEKFVVSYGNYYTQGSYYMASVADKMYLNPVGAVVAPGFAAQIPFFKKMIDDWGIKAQVYYAGKFKSATEPFRRTNMSNENRLQTRQYLNEGFNIFLEDMAKSRNKSLSEMKDIVSEYRARNAQDAVDYGLIDELKYKDQVLDDLKDRIGLEEDDDIEAIGIKKYHKAAKKKSDYSIKDRIAVVYAEGNIVDGEGETGNIGGDRYAKIIRKIRKDDKVKAIVLRVNSGGGSALASEVILRELIRAKEEGKNVVVSMGDVAASGGYYIACEADKIFAEANTITGSIGVFGLLPSVQNMMDKEIGITFDTVKTGRFATTGTPFFDLNEAEGQIIQQSVDEVYTTFKQRVADGRDMTVEDVDEVAQGRVWTGKKASTIGLVDELGGLDDALAAAAELADLENYRVKEYPRTKEPIQQLLDDLMGKETTKTMIKNEIGEDFYKYYEYAKQIKNMSGPQARMPFMIEIK